VAPPRAAAPNVPAAQVNVPAAGHLGQAPLGVAASGSNVPAALVNVLAAGQLVQPPTSAASPNVLAEQVIVPAAGQLGQASLGVAGSNVPAPLVNVIAARQLAHPPPGTAVATSLLHKSMSLLPEN